MRLLSRWRAGEVRSAPGLETAAIVQGWRALLVLQVVRICFGLVVMVDKADEEVECERKRGQSLVLLEPPQGLETPSRGPLNLMLAIMLHLGYLFHQMGQDDSFDVRDPAR
jgi:hypothetical protein